MNQSSDETAPSAQQEPPFGLVVIGWLLGIALVAGGAYFIGLPIHDRLAAGGASEVVANLGLLVGGGIGVIGMFVLNAALSRVF